MIAAAGLPAIVLLPLQRGPAHELVLDTPLLTRLQTLAGGLHQEIVLCLQGRVRGGVATLTDFEMPVPRLSTPTRSSFDPCPRGTIASWHNHPMGAQAAASAAADADEGARRARRLCVLSELDIQTATRLRHPFVVVSVDATTWCWWTLGEVDRFAEQSISRGPPAPGRIARGGRNTVWARPATENAAPLAEVESGR